MKYFYRQSIRERGHGTNHPTFNPIEKLGFDDNEIEICIGQICYKYQYKDLSMIILNTYIQKSYGTVGAWMNQTLITIKSPDKNFKFDLSNNFPDFKETKEIIEILKSKIPFEIKSVSKKQVQKKTLINITLLFFCMLIIYVFTK